MNESLEGFYDNGTGAGMRLDYIFWMPDKNMYRARVNDEARNLYAVDYADTPMQAVLAAISAVRKKKK